MIRLLSLLIVLTVLARRIAAQDPALVEALAPLMMAEDRRVLDQAIFGTALEHADPYVRRTAAIAIGRIGDPAGLSLLLPRLNDPDPSVVSATFFGIGLLGQREAVEPLISRLLQTDSLDQPSLTAATVALARIGGAEAGQALADVVSGVGAVPIARRDAMRSEATLNFWRLGEHASTDGLIRLARDTSAATRWRALFSLGRLRTPEAAELLLSGLRDPVAIVRETAADALVKRYVRETTLDPAVVVAELNRAADDPVPAVRINALLSVASFADASTGAVARARLQDEDHNVRVVAAEAIAASGDTTLADDLVRALDPEANDWGVRQAVLNSLARLSPQAFEPWGNRWLDSRDPFDRLAALDAWRLVRPRTTAPFIAALDDPDARVQAAALGAWAAADSVPSDQLRIAAERAWRSEDPALAISGLRILASSPTDAALDLLAAAWQRNQGPMRESVLGILGAWARRDPAIIERLAAPSRQALLERPSDPVLRATATRRLPTLAAVWGPVAPIETGLTLEDYRQLVAGYLLAPENPRVVIDVAGRGTIEIELLPHDAPLTVANFLKLVDRRYFDNVRWHRVVPNFVVQDGDPTGTGEGGPGWAIRDEINRLRYDTPMVGMALSGPDTGGSQWFINLSPQPHLDGGYTIFGRVVGSYAALQHVLQGDLIRSITRVGSS